jgi:glycosyltransferase involved in cell wall biosynthesis
VFSVIVPSFNQAGFLEKTLESLANEQAGLARILIADGGSTDGSLEILKKWSPRIEWWCSEPDHGQSDAINKALARVRTAFWSYLNSDDLLLPGALSKVAGVFSDTKTEWVGGVSEIIEDDEVIGEVRAQSPLSSKDYLTPWSRNHQYVFPCSNVSFMRTEVISKLGSFDQTFHFGMDIEYYCRSVFLAGSRPVLLPDILGKWRLHAESKTMRDGLAWGFRHDEVRIAEKYVGFLSLDQQRETLKEIALQKKWLVCRKAMHSINKGDRSSAKKELWQGVFRMPQLLGFRPWLGAIRRVYGSI